MQNSECGITLRGERFAAEASKYLENVESPSVLLVRGHIVRRSSFALLITATKPKTPPDRERQLALYKLSRKVRVRVYSTDFPEG